MDINWDNYIRFFNRPLTVNQAQFYSWSCADDLEELIGNGIRNQLYVVKKDNADGYFHKTEWKNFNEHVYNVNFQDEDFLNNSNKIIEKISKESEEFFLTFSDIDFSTLSNQELSKKFQESDHLLKTKVAALWLGFLIEDVIEKRMLEVLEKYNLPAEESLEALSLLGRHNHVTREKIDLMNIVISSEDIESDLKKHHAKYEYIPCYSVDVLPYNLEYFKKRIEGVSKEDANNNIKDIEKGIADSKKKLKEILKTKSFDHLDELFIIYFHEFSSFKDYRSHYRSILMYYSRKLFLEIAHRYKLEVTDVSLLLSQEIVKLLEQESISQEIKKTIEERRETNSIYEFNNGKERLIPMEVEEKISIGDQKEIKGITANKGKVRGVVKIVMNPNHAHKVEEGDILVSSMTRPDFVPVMKKAGAIVTDEGSILCHAAIVSRELNKPCIISTKSATQILQDGDFVEVDADNGIIRIINRK